MDASTSILLSIALVLALNNAMVRLPFLKDRAPLFWLVQVLNISASSALLLWGIPGLTDMPAVSWMLALLFLLHVAQNFRWQAQRRRARDVPDAVESRRSAIRAALGEESDTDS